MISSIRFYSGPIRKRPKEGDEKIDKKTGKTLVRRQCRTKDGAYIVNNGRPVLEWVEK